MVVPVDRTVELNVTAPDFDVIHSWWIPALGGKIDAIPGKVNHTWFRAEEEGDYEGNCTEFCGLQHAEMTMSVRAVAASGYEAPSRALAVNGQAQFEAACAKCHNVQGPQLVGPTLGATRRSPTAQALALLVRNGRNEMPAVGARLERRQIATLMRVHDRAGGGQWRLSRPSRSTRCRGTAAGSRAGSSRPTTSASGSSTSGRASSSSSRRAAGAADPHRAAHAGDGGRRQPRDVQPALHDARPDDGLPGHRPDPRRASATTSCR